MTGVVGARFGREGLGDMSHARSKADQHLLDDGVLTDQDPPAADLRWQVAIADMPGQTRQLLSIDRGDGQQGFGGGGDQNDAAILKAQAIAAAQHGGPRQVEQEFGALLGNESQSAPVAFIVTECDAIERRRLPAASLQHLCRPEHRVGHRLIFSRGSSAARVAAPARVHRSEARHRPAPRRSPHPPRCAASHR
jgi:hypothetical protein